MSDSVTANNKVSTTNSLLGPTLSTDGKRHVANIRKNSTRFKPTPSPPPDPNSEAKSLLIKRVQSQVEVWDHELKSIKQQIKDEDKNKKETLMKYQKTIIDLTGGLNESYNQLVAAKGEKDLLSQSLNVTTYSLEKNDQKIIDLNSELEHYKKALSESENKNMELFNKIQVTSQELQKSQEMRLRLHEEFTVLEGRLAIEEKRSSKICSLM